MPPPREGEWADEDFIPRDGPDPVEDLRRYVRQRLRRGATQREVEDELTGQGLDPDYAIRLVSSVRTTGKYGELEVGTELFVNGLPAGFFQNPVFEKRLRLARRQQRREREAGGEAGEPDPALDFGAATTPERELARYLSRQRRRLLVIAGAVALVALAAGYLLSR